MKKVIAALIVVLALIILLTGTPEDLFTTVPLIAILGFNAHLLLVGIILVLLLVNNGKKD